jgi:hypothetical protein
MFSVFIKSWIWAILTTSRAQGFRVQIDPAASLREPDHPAAFAFTRTAIRVMNTVPALRRRMMTA